MESLERLPNIVRLSERVVRVLGLNPGKFTLQGTNTYLIGKGSCKVLLDTGEGHPEYIPLLQTALDKDLGGATISKVICSHWHHDHVGGVSDVMKFLTDRNIHLTGPTSTLITDAGSLPSTVSGGSSSSSSTSSTTETSPVPALVQMDPKAVLPSVFKYPDPQHDDPNTVYPFQRIKDEEEIRVDDQTTLVTLHTPGHTADHCSFWLKEENTLFTADCVLGQGTAVFEDLASYMKSLEKQLLVGSGGQGSSGVAGAGVAAGAWQPSYKIYPGHGPVIEDGPAKIREYIKHRLEREKQILGVLSSFDNGLDGDNNSNNSSDDGIKAARGGGGKTAMQIVQVIYEAYPTSLHAAAEHQVLLHLKKLEQDGKIRKRVVADLDPEDISDIIWEPIQQAQL
ncbi:hypothetical protein EDD11_003450 [Mortierella claussenii]|nr:hypothetical protein EDD11_003450 [Mortierella claussenii]